MRKRVAMTVWISALIAGWLFWVGPVAAVAAPKAYVGLFKDDAVAVIDTTQNRVVATIPVPKGPHGLVVTPDGRKVYVSSDGMEMRGTRPVKDDPDVTDEDMRPIVFCSMQTET